MIKAMAIEMRKSLVGVDTSVDVRTGVLLILSISVEKW